MFFSFNAVDDFNFFFPEHYKPEVYVGATVGVAASAGGILTVIFPPREKHFTVLLLTQVISGILLVFEVILTPLDTISTPLRFGLAEGHYMTLWGNIFPASEYMQPSLVECVLLELLL